MEGWCWTCVRRCWFDDEIGLVTIVLKVQMNCNQSNSVLSLAEAWALRFGRRLMLTSREVEKRRGGKRREETLSN